MVLYHQKLWLETIIATAIFVNSLSRAEIVPINLSMNEPARLDASCAKPPRIAVEGIAHYLMGT